MKRRPRPWILLGGVVLFGWCAACAGRNLMGGGQALPTVLMAIDEEAVDELRRAWMIAHAGTAAAEEVVVVTKTIDGGYEAVLQPPTNRYGSGKFALPVSAAAIFHTHSNNVLPDPSAHDRRLADRIGIPVFAMSNQGLFVYDPKTRKAWKVMNRLDWLQADSWRRLLAESR